MNLRQKISEAMKQFKWFFRMVVGAVTMFYLTMLAAGRLVIGICSQLDWREPVWKKNRRK